MAAHARARAILSVMRSEQDSRLWHPFADMGSGARRRAGPRPRRGRLGVGRRRHDRYLDATASLWYCNVGHGRPRDRRRRRRPDGQARGLLGLRRLRQPARAGARRAARRARADGGDARVFLASGGGDAVDTAAKLARRFWLESGEPEREHLVVRSNGYHGTHGFGTSLAGIEANRVELGPARPRHRRRRARLGRRAARARSTAIGARPRRRGLRRAGDRRRRRRTRRRRATSRASPSSAARPAILFVCDSVICGFGRLGTWFGIERWDVEPDMIMFAKGVTSGYLPLGGVVVSERVAEPFFGEAGRPDLPPRRHLRRRTPTCCAAALANLDMLERDGLLERGQELEGDLHDALQPLADHDARRRGPRRHAGCSAPSSCSPGIAPPAHRHSLRPQGRRARAPAGQRRRGLAAADGDAGALRADRRGAVHGARRATPRALKRATSCARASPRSPWASCSTRKAWPSSR